MRRSLRHRITATALAGASLLIAAAPVAAVTPSVDTWTVHREGAFVDCPGFATIGIWDITHKLTTFYNGAGDPVRDIEAVDYTGRIVNPTTGAWVPDAGARTFFDTLAPDGSFLTTYMVEVRKSEYVHQAGRTDFQTGGFHGRDGFGAGNIDALCQALGG